MRLRTRALGALVLVLVLVVACKRTRAGRAPSAGPSASATQGNAAKTKSFADRKLLGLGSFDLVSSEGGAALVWASRGGGLSLTLLDEAGGERQTGSALPEPSDAGTQPSAQGTPSIIAEVALAARGSELGIAWLEQAGNVARARGFLRSASANGSSTGQVIEIGGMLAPVSAPRGNLAITSNDDRFLVLARGQKSDCVDATESDCVGFGFHRLEATRAVSQSLPLTVPLPCEQNSVSFAVASKRWYYGVCSRATGKPVTTLFSIQSDPAYARADRILEGCLPLGALAQGDDLLVVGDCAGQRRGVRVRGGNAETAELRVDRLDAVCASGRPLIRQVGLAGLQLPLDAPQNRLEAFLPDGLAPPLSRAVWTGQTLLVASLNGGIVTLKGYRCDSTLLREVPLRSSAR